MRGAQVESGVVSHKCLEANLINAKTTTNLSAGVCDYSHYFPLQPYTHIHKQWVFLGLKAVGVASFLVLFCLGLWRDSSLYFCPIALVFTPLNSTKTLFSYGMHKNEICGRTRKLDTIKETGKSHIWLYLRATKWRLESNRMWHHILIQRSLHILAYVQLAYCCCVLIRIS